MAKDWAAEVAELEEREAELRTEIAEVRCQKFKAYERAKREELEQQINVSGGVRIAHRLPSNDPHAALNDVPGTLLEVRRTRAIVDFGQPHGKWNWRMSNLIPASKEQGIEIPLG